MTNYNNQLEDANEEECDCIVCQNVEEFRSLVSDNVDWESALRHVLYVATSKDDEMLSEIIDEVADDAFNSGFEEGILFVAEQAQRVMDGFVDEIKDKVYEVRDRREYPEDYVDEIEVDKPSDKLEDLSDEQYDEIQKIIRADI